MEMKEFKKIASKIARMTDNNEHTDAVVFLASYFGKPYQRVHMEHIQHKYSLMGSMEHTWITEREEIRKSIIKSIESIYGKDQAMIINRSF